MTYDIGDQQLHQQGVATPFSSRYVLKDLSGIPRDTIAGTVPNGSGWTLHHLLGKALKIQVGRESTCRAGTGSARGSLDNHQNENICKIPAFMLTFKSWLQTSTKALAIMGVYHDHRNMPLYQHKLCDRSASHAKTALMALTDQLDSPSVLATLSVCLACKRQRHLELSIPQLCSKIPGNVTLSPTSSPQSIPHSMIQQTGLSDVWRWTWERKASIIVVRIKQKRMPTKKSQRLRAELKVWSRLTRYIVPLYGTASGFGQFVASVYPWYDNGSLSGSLESYGQTVSIINCFQLLSDIFAGLQHLHSCSAVQGDLTGVEFVGASYFTSALDGTVRFAQDYVPSTLNLTLAPGIDTLLRVEASAQAVVAISLGTELSRPRSLVAIGVLFSIAVHSILLKTFTQRMMHDVQYIMQGIDVMMVMNFAVSLLTHVGGRKDPSFSTRAMKLANFYADDYLAQQQLNSTGMTLNGALDTFAQTTRGGLIVHGKMPVVWEVVARSFRIIQAPSNHFYLDYGAGEGLGDDPIGLAYTFHLLENLTEAQYELVVGGEQILWSEQSGPQNVDPIVWPCVASSAEIFWSGKQPTGAALNVAEALPRLHDVRYRMVQCGINAIPLQPQWCALRLDACGIYA
ncbi:uncharacterized protein F5147DRAFT_657572 [Suillus discolor]|uniref:beta-N-acetylhexosaminidase n=1 Tax=Suillus discolor TaxID=1912936 RepID=A0A9P7JNG6_9AGAM|nr:uncharacterized protein F5147DRAFT_657572 [Suillus discolor]KAG2092785.1 hypothetical protein F5147DRAFT_657572 [Suillus discolor]